uniref:Coilin tudor domain-containing protein n=1 Tax=Chloropicon primus TaxID=1764295 RepID=A0A7S2T5P4_9CHLO
MEVRRTSWRNGARRLTICIPREILCQELAQHFTPGEAYRVALDFEKSNKETETGGVDDRGEDLIHLWREVRRSFGRYIGDEWREDFSLVAEGGARLNPLNPTIGVAEGDVFELSRPMAWEKNLWPDAAKGVVDRGQVLPARPEAAGPTPVKSPSRSSLRKSKKRMGKRMERLGRLNLIDAAKVVRDGGSKESRQQQQHPAFRGSHVVFGEGGNEAAAEDEQASPSASGRYEFYCEGASADRSLTRDAFLQDAGKYSAYPLLEEGSLPKEGAKIAYRILEIVEPGIPQLSGYRLGTVQQANEQTTEVTVVPAEEPGYGLSEKYTEDGTLRADLRDLQEIRVLEESVAGASDAGDSLVPYNRVAGPPKPGTSKEFTNCKTYESYLEHAHKVFEEEREASALARGTYEDYLDHAHKVFEATRASALAEGSGEGSSEGKKKSAGNPKAAPKIRKGSMSKKMRAKCFSLSVGHMLKELQ